MRSINEEKILPLLRARLAENLFRMGFKGKQIATVLNVTPAAVTQYLKGKRGNKLPDSGTKLILNALTDRAAQRIRSGTGSLEFIELLDAAYQLLSAQRGQRILESRAERPVNQESIRILRQRLQLELKAAEKCLDLANRTRDDYTKLFLRMIASDSIRHADIVSQMISWSEGTRESEFQPPAKEILGELLAIEDRAGESSLTNVVKIPNPAAMLLLESIDMDEEKHDTLVGKLMRRMGPSSAERR